MTTALFENPPFSAKVIVADLPVQDVVISTVEQMYYVEIPPSVPPQSPIWLLCLIGILTVYEGNNTELNSQFSTWEWVRCPIKGGSVSGVTPQAMSPVGQYAFFPNQMDLSMTGNVEIVEATVEQTVNTVYKYVRAVKAYAFL